jgi:hypothetical protein
MKNSICTRKSFTGVRTIVHKLILMLEDGNVPYSRGHVGISNDLKSTKFLPFVAGIHHSSV